MTFTTLEASLLASFLSLVVGLAVHLFTKHNYVSTSQCDERRAHVCTFLKSVEDGNEALAKDLKDRTNILFRMMRAMVAHDKDLPADVKAAILNETPGGE